MRWLLLLPPLLFLLSCKLEGGPSPKGGAGSETILARVDDIPITNADMQELLARYANQPFVLARYSSLEKRKELLESLIRYDVMVIEARKRGYERDPEVQRAAKDKMVKLFTQQEIFDKLKLSDIPETDVEKYYKDHAIDYVRPETVRVSEILVRDKSRAQKALTEVKALAKMDLKGLRELVNKYSEDADSKVRGGDLTQFDKNTTSHPHSVVTAAFGLKNVGDVSDLVATDGGFAILKLTERRPAISRSIDDARLEIQRRLLEELRNKRRKEFVEAARKEIKVEIYEDQLMKLTFGPAASADGGTSPAQSAGSAPTKTLLHDAEAMVGKSP